MKKIIATILVGSIALGTVGCVSADIGLHKAITQTKEITEQETDTKVTFEMVYEGLNTELEEQVVGVADVVNSLEIKNNTKIKTNKEKTRVKNSNITEVSYPNMALGFNTWSEMDLDESEFKVIIEIPEKIKQLIAAIGLSTEEYQTKDYILLDMEKELQDAETLEELKGLTEFQKEATELLQEYIKGVGDKLKIKGKEVTQEGTVEKEGEKQKVYRLRLTEESMRDYLDDIVEYVTTERETKELIEQITVKYEKYIRSVKRSDRGTEEYEKWVLTEVQDVQEQMYNSIEEIEEQYKEYKENYKDIKVLGDKGIDIKYTVNKEGYIVEEEGLIDVNLDLAAIKEAVIGKEEITTENETIAGMLEGKISLIVKYTISKKNINNKEMKIEYPELTEENTIDFMGEVEGVQQKVNIEE